MPTATILFFIAVFVSTLYWLVLLLKLALHNNSRSYGKKGTLSIVIAAKNEAENLQNNIPLWLNLDPKPQEILIIDDYSTDKTAKIIKSYSRQEVRYLSASKNIMGKKAALTEGINACTGETILLTDADCQPASSQWSAIMQAHIDQQSVIALGYGPMIKTPGFLNKFIRYETLLVAVQYFAFTLLGIPYMAVGRNLAFAKSAFLRNKGYERHEDLASGDDDLFIRDNATKNNTSIVLDPDSFVYSHAANSLSNYIRQKTRHLSTAKHYKTRVKLLLSIHPFFYLMACLLSFYLLLNGNYLLVLSVWLIRWALLIIFGKSCFDHLDAKDLILYIPLLDLCWFPHYLYFTIPSFKSSSNHWN